MDRRRPSPITVSGFGGGGCGTRLGAAVCLLLLIGYGVLWSGMVQGLGGADGYVRRSPFLATLTGATLVAHGEGARLYDPDAQATAQTALLDGDPLLTDRQSYSEPPFAAVALAPLVQLDLPATGLFTAWAVLTTTAAGLCVGLLAGGWPTAQGTPWLLMLAATSFLPLISSLMLGQSGVPALLGWVGVTVGLKGRHDALAGLLGGLVALHAPSLPALLLLLILARRPRALAALVSILVVGGAVVTPLLGTDWPGSYLALLRATPGAWPVGAAWAAPALAAGALVALWGAVPAGDPLPVAWDRRWASSLLLVVLGLAPFGPPLLLLGLIPGWIFGTHAATGLLSPRARRGWIAGLAAGYSLGFVAVLAPLALPPLATLWTLGALAAGLRLLWNAECGVRSAE